MREFQNILVRATNWVGDAVMSIPALRALRARYPGARITLLAKPWVADMYRREPFADAVLIYNGNRRQTAAMLRERRFDCAILLQNAFDAALLAWLARIPVRIGYKRDGRGLLLTQGVAVPKPGEIPRHERFYYLELLRRAGVIDGLPEDTAIRLSVRAAPGNKRVVVGVSPGAAYGSAKRWLPERFAEAAAQIARERGAAIAIFGAKNERELAESVAVRLADFKVHNYAGQTSLAEFIDLAAQCEVFLTNDSGAMHIASALGVPTVAIFGATDYIATGPTGPHTRVVRAAVECSPCLRRECNIDHRCMTRVTAAQVATEALELVQLGVGK